MQQAAPRAGRAEPSIDASTLSSGLRCVRLQAIERTGPAADMAVALGLRLERRLVEAHAGLAALVDEADGDHRLQTAFALLLPGEGEDKALRRRDLAEDAAERQQLAGLAR